MADVDEPTLKTKELIMSLNEEIKDTVNNYTTKIDKLLSLLKETGLKRPLQGLSDDSVRMCRNEHQHRINAKARAK